MRFAWNDAELEKHIDSQSRRLLSSIAWKYERIIQSLFRTPKHGRLYQVSGGAPTAKQVRAYRNWKTGKRKTRPSGLYRASAPGEAPAIRTGRLRQSVTHEFERTARGEDFILIGTTIQSPPYPRYLEFGTKKMKPRPAWIPALERLRAELSGGG